MTVIITMAIPREVAAVILRDGVKQVSYEMVPDSFSPSEPRVLVRSVKSNTVSPN